MSTKAKFTDYKHAGCIVWTAVCVQCTCTCYSVCILFHMSVLYWTSFLEVLFPSCHCVFVWIQLLCFTAPLSAFPLAFPHFSIYLSHLFLLNTLALVHLCPCPSFLSFPLFYLPLPFLAPVWLHPYSTSSLTNEATGWLQVVVHQGHDSSWPSQSNDTISPFHCSSISSTFLLTVCPLKEDYSVDERYNITYR